jgi:hypothetical protein
MIQAEIAKDPPKGWSEPATSLDDMRRSLRAQVQGGRFPNLPLPRRFASDGLYQAAALFLLDVREVLGEAAFSAAAKDIYLASDFGRYNLREKRIEDIFLAHTKASERDNLMALFNRAVWGDNGERYRELQEQDSP